MFFLNSQAYSTILDEAKWLKNLVEIKQRECADLCALHSFLATLDIVLFVPIGWIDLACGGDRFYRAHKNRTKADGFAHTRKSLNKLIWFLKNVEKAFVNLQQVKENNLYLDEAHGFKFRVALNEMRIKSESEADTINRIHSLNQAGVKNLTEVDPFVDYYSSIRSMFCRAS
jgi:hypothetical protein